MRLISSFKKLFLPKNEFQKGVSWNALTFFVMGLAGIAINILIIAVYGSEMLGVFNQVYAAYIFFSQIAAFGIHNSVLKYIPQYHNNKKTQSEIILSGLIAGIITTTIVSFFYLKTASLISTILKSPNVLTGLYLALLGLWCFAINKILLAYLNGLQLMKHFALFNIFRYLAILISLIALIYFNIPGPKIPLVFSISESMLLAVLLFFCLKFFSFAAIKKCRKWIKTHFIFGLKSIAGGAITELNSRIDVFMLGIFSTDKIVGIYSLAAIIADGIYQIPSIFRVNYNPLLSQLVSSGKLKELKKMIKNFLKKWVSFAAVIALLSVISYPVATNLITKEPIIIQSWIVFTILISGIMIFSGYAVFWELPSQSGFPGWQTLLIISNAGTNTFLNLLLIPLFGLYGAALATSLSFIFSIFFLKSTAKKLLNINI